MDMLCLRTSKTILPIYGSSHHGSIRYKGGKRKKSGVVQSSVVHPPVVTHGRGGNDGSGIRDTLLLLLPPPEAARETAAPSLMTRTFVYTPPDPRMPRWRKPPLTLPPRHRALLLTRPFEIRSPPPPLLLLLLFLFLLTPIVRVV